VNQVELSWHNPQPSLLSWAKEKGILLEAYSPLGSNNQVKETLNVPEVKEVAAELGISAAQVVISWLYQRGTVVLPKSVHTERIRENLQSKSLTALSSPSYLEYS
jgi:diketogulonate reductase-like aldo/keto reductase